MAHADAERAGAASSRPSRRSGVLATPTGEPLAARSASPQAWSSWATFSGEGPAQEEAVVGETPNLAARWRRFARAQEVVIGEGKRQLLGALVEVEDLGVQAQGTNGAGPGVRVPDPARSEPLRGTHAGELAPIVGVTRVARLTSAGDGPTDGEGQWCCFPASPEWASPPGADRPALREALAPEREPS